MNANKHDKGKILDILQQETSRSRKSLIRSLMPLHIGKLKHLIKKADLLNILHKQNIY